MNRFLFVILLLFCETAFSQNINSIKLAKEKSEKEITYLNKLIKDARESQTTSLQKLVLLKKKIENSRSILNSLKQEVGILEDMIASNENRITELTSQKTSMQALYAKSIYNSWKLQNHTSEIEFLLSSEDFNQAYNRLRYFRQMNDFTKYQMTIISQLNDSLSVRNEELKSLISNKNTALTDIDKKNRELSSQQQLENKYVTELKKREKQLKDKLEKEQQNRRKLENELQKLIAVAVKKSGSTTEKTIKLTPKEQVLSDDFASNKGKLPWPVERGVITEKFGVHSDPLHKMVQMENGGINITTSKDAYVRSVFGGVVLSISFVQDNNNVVIIRHGSYLTVYANLSEVYVKSGEVVTTKQRLGRIAFDNESGSVLKFQVWKNTQKYNPELWLVK